MTPEDFLMWAHVTFQCETKTDAVKAMAQACLVSEFSVWGWLKRGKAPDNIEYMFDLIVENDSLRKKLRQNG